MNDFPPLMRIQKRNAIKFQSEVNRSFGMVYSKNRFGNKYSSERVGIVDINSYWYSHWDDRVNRFMAIANGLIEIGRMKTFSHIRETTNAISDKIKQMAGVNPLDSGIEKFIDAEANKLIADIFYCEKYKALGKAHRKSIRSKWASLVMLNKNA